MEEIAALGLEPDKWETSLCEVRGRTAVGPDGSGEATVKDGIVLMTRRCPAMSVAVMVAG